MQPYGVTPLSTPDYNDLQVDSLSAVFEKIKTNKIYDIAGYPRANISLKQNPNTINEYTLTLYSEVPMESQDYSVYNLTLNEWKPISLTYCNRYNPDMNDKRTEEEKLKTFY
ncbi:MAG: hypothetical protein JSR46_08125 [Verrucomicrobia bacterium]|nr:hypothetical protein [Verrucomicrobiota bacterium]